MSDLIYKPYENEIKPIECTMGCKFSDDIFLTKSFLDQRNIEYKMQDLEDGPMGLCLRIKKDNATPRGAG